MIMGLFILNKRYSVLDYLVALVFCFGLIVFTLADKAVSPEFDPYGIFLICLALIADAFIGNLQVWLFLVGNLFSGEFLVCPRA